MMCEHNYFVSGSELRCSWCETRWVETVITDPDILYGYDNSNQPDTSLSLLVIDLGDSCVVKVEQGEITTHHNLFKYLTEIGFWHSKVHLITSKSFAAVRDAIDSQDKPVPRIERYKPSTLDDYILICDPYDRAGFTANGRRVITRKELDALSQLAGHPLPIWDGGGKWTLLKGSEMPGIAMFRYTRGGE